ISLRSCIRSGRVPFGRLFQVGAKSDTWLSQSVPAACALMTNRASDVVGALPVVSVTVNFFQLGLTPGMFARAKAVCPSLLSMAAVRGPFIPSDRAKNEAL